MMQVASETAGQRTTNRRSTSATPGRAQHLLFVPAMGVAVRFYHEFLTGLARRCGATASVVELPGQGTHAQRAERGDDYGYREVVEELLPEAVRVIEGRHPGGRIAIVGHSLGGQLALLSCAAIGAQVARVVLIAAGTAHWRAWPEGQRARAAVTVHGVAAAAAMLPWYPGERLGFGGNQSRRFMRDWSFNAKTGRYRLEGSSRNPEALHSQLSQSRVRVYAVSIAGDAVAPRGATDELLRLLPRADVTRREVAGIASDSPWRRHFSWARQPSDVESAVAMSLLETDPAPPAQDLDSAVPLSSLPSENVK